MGWGDMVKYGIAWYGIVGWYSMAGVVLYCDATPAWYIFMICYVDVDVDQ